MHTVQSERVKCVSTSSAGSCSSVCWPSGLSGRFLHTLLLAPTPAVAMETQLAGTICGLSGVLPHVHAPTQAPLRDGTRVHGFTTAGKTCETDKIHTYTHILIHAHFSIPSVLHLIYPSFPSLSFSLLSVNETMSTAHNQAPGPAQHCQKGAHDPIFCSGSIISVLWRETAYPPPYKTHTQDTKTHNLQSHHHWITGIYFSDGKGVPVQRDNKSTHHTLWSDKSR